MVNEWNIMPIQTIMFTVYNLKFPCNINPVSECTRVALIIRARSSHAESITNRAVGEIVFQSCDKICHKYRHDEFLRVNSLVSGNLKFWLERKLRF